MAFHVFSEKRQVGEICLVGHFLDALVRPFQQHFNVFCHVVVDDVRGCVSAYLLADGGKVFRRDVQFVGIPCHRPVFRERAGNEFRKCEEQVLARGVVAWFQGNISFQHVVELVHEGAQECVGRFPLVLVMGACQFLAQQVIILAEKGDFVR